jgi:hypothetical protein
MLAAVLMIAAILATFVILEPDDRNPTASHG